MSTTSRTVRALKGILRNSVDLADPDAVVAFLNTRGWWNGTKATAVDAYCDYFDTLRLAGISLPKIL